MVELTSRQRALLSEKLPDLANIAAGALVFGQTLNGLVFSYDLALLGVSAWILFIGLALWWAKERR